VVRRLDVVWMVISPGFSHFFRLCVIRHHIVVAREFFVAKNSADEDWFFATKLFPQSLIYYENGTGFVTVIIPEDKEQNYDPLTSVWNLSLSTFCR
jgi:hypothetical protein